MIFFANDQGTIFNSLPTPVYQGAANANTVYLVAPFKNAQVTVAFRLPNGIWTTPNVMKPNMAFAAEMPEITDKKGNSYSVWTCELGGELTELYGVVTAQFFFYGGNAGVRIATSSTTFVVAKGVPSVLPSAPTPTVYEQILENLASIQEQLDNGSYAARAIYAWNSEFTYGAKEITYYREKGEFGAFVRSVKVNNKNHSPYIDGEINAEWWEEVVDFNVISEKYFQELQRFLSDGESTVKGLVREAEGYKDQAETARDEAQEAQGEAEKQAIRAENAASNLENLIGDTIVFVPELPPEEEAEFGKLYAVIKDEDSNFFDLYTLKNTEEGGREWRYLGSENVLSNGVKIYSFELVGGGGWVGKRQSVQIPEFNTTFNVTVSAEDGSAKEYVLCGVTAESLSNQGVLTFVCSRVPSSNLKVNVEVCIQFELPSVAEYYTKPQTDALVDEERKRAERAEGENSESISQEAARAKEEEAGLSKKIEAETERAEGAEQAAAKTAADAQAKAESAAQAAEEAKKILPDPTGNNGKVLGVSENQYSLMEQGGSGVQTISGRNGVRVQAESEGSFAVEGITATPTEIGVTLLHTKDDCTTFESDDGAATPAAVKKAITETFKASSTQFGSVKVYVDDEGYLCIDTE